MVDLNQWWNSLTDARKILFVAHASDDVLPAEVVAEFIVCGQFVAGGDGFAQAGGWPFRWPADVREFLLARRSEVRPL